MTDNDAVTFSRKDFSSDQDVRWCPGCGDYSILATVQRTMPELGIAPHDMVWVSGIGCSSRFPYYMNTFGFHTIHGRAPAIATGIKVANPNLLVWVVTGDGDGLSIGGNHLMHAMRRNVDINVLLFNNRIYGLTKGQYSPTSELGKVTKSSPSGSADYPVDPASFALGCNAGFVARSLDTDAPHLAGLLKRAASHHGTTFTEIYQNCPAFNDGAFTALRTAESRPDNTLYVEHGKPLLFGADGKKGLRINPQRIELEIVTVGVDGVCEADVLVHDETNRSLASFLARMKYPEFPVAIGVLYASPNESYHSRLLEGADNDAAPSAEVLHQLVTSGETWVVH